MTAPRRTHRRFTAPAAATATALAAASLLVGCSGTDAGDEDANLATTTQTAAPETRTSTAQHTDAEWQDSQTPQAAAAAAPPAAGTDDRQQRSERPGDLGIREVRVGTHGDFDRVVFELSGDADPTWFTRYTTEPTQQASGLPVAYDGAVALTVNLEPMTLNMQDLANAPEPGPAAGGAGVVTGVSHEGIFEANAQYTIGLTEKRPYTVEVLRNPSRVVVDFHSA